jgi:hypothetical protein
MAPTVPDQKVSGIGDALVRTVDDTATIVDSIVGNKYYDTDISWPQIAAAYKATYENFSFGITGSFQSYEVSDTRGDYQLLSTPGPTFVQKTGRSYDVDSHALKVGLQGDFGVLKLGATYGFGQNVANMGLAAASKKGGGDHYAYYRGERDAGGDFIHAPGVDPANPGTAYDKIGNIDTVAYTIVGSFKVNDQVTLEAGYGKISNDVDDGEQDDEARAYYLQAAITVADGFTVTPEIGKYDYEEDCSGNDEGDATYFGAKWQINF